MAKLPHRRRSQKETVGTIRRGEIYLCTFDPSVGHEIRKTRPALIIQNDIGNRYSPLTIVSAITSRVSPVPYPVEVVVDPTNGNGLGVTSSIRLDQVRTADRQRLIRRLGVLDTTTMARVDDAIKVSLGMINL